jgi:hypothetical protein
LKVRARKQKSLGIGLPDSSQKQVPFVFPLSLFGVLIYCNLGCLINKLFIIILLYEQVLMNFNEYKRRQGSPGIKITPRAFGKDRRYPITNNFKLY